MPLTQVLLDDARPGHERLRRYTAPSAVVEAHTPTEVPAALARLEAAVRAGAHAAGYFSYELGYVLEPRLLPLLPVDRAAPLLWFGLFDTVETLESSAANAALQSAGRAYAGPLAHEWSEAAYAARFARVHEWIEAGDIYQANLSFRSRFAFAGDPMALYFRLRARSAAAHGAFINDGARDILSLSPELFFDLAPHGLLTAKPMKGTIGRGTDPASDHAARARLATSEKDRAENLMIVDLLRNDLGRIAQIGSVMVEDLFAVETYPTLHTMVSTVSAGLTPDTGVAKIVRALFPCGSVTGAPKIRAMEIIREMESSPRGIYCGAIGHFAPDGSANFNVAIRTLTIAGNRGELGIGGAVVHDSQSAAEYAECLLKARYYDSVRQPLELIETLRWSPDEGFHRLDRHLARMEHSAEIFGIHLDREKSLKTLSDATSLSSPVYGGGGERTLRARDGGGESQAQRVRLTLNESGDFDATATPLGEPKDRWTYVISSKRVSSTDELARHKTNRRDLYETEFSRLTAETGCDEVIFLNERGEIAEGARTNVFARIGGELFTPPLSAGILDGVLRRELVDAGQCTERTLTQSDLAAAEEAYLGNSLRGLIRAVPAKEEDSRGDAEARSEAVLRVLRGSA